MHLISPAVIAACLTLAVACSNSGPSAERPKTTQSTLSMEESASRLDSDSDPAPEIGDVTGFAEYEQELQRQTQAPCPTTTERRETWNDAGRQIIWCETPGGTRHGWYIEVSLLDPDRADAGGRYEHGIKQGIWREFSGDPPTHRDMPMSTDTGEYRDGVKHGDWLHHDNRNLLVVIPYRAGKRQGLWRRFHSNGQRHSVQPFSNGVAIGPLMTWHRTGQRQTWENYSNNSVEKGYLAWYPNGQLRTKRASMAGPDRREQVTRWHANGQVAESPSGRAGRGPPRVAIARGSAVADWLRQHPCPRDTRRQDVTRTLGEWHRELTEFDDMPSTRTLRQIMRDNDILTNFDSAEELRVVTCELASGELDGPGAGWSGSGRQVFAVHHRIGRPDGTWRTWHANGVLRNETSYAAGRLEGPTATWNDNGQLIVRGSHAFGVRTDQWRWFSGDGLLTNYHSYTAGQLSSADGLTLAASITLTSERLEDAGVAREVERRACPTDVTDRATQDCQKLFIEHARCDIIPNPASRARCHTLAEQDYLGDALKLLDNPLWTPLN